MRKINFPLRKDAKSNKQMNLRKFLHVSATILVDNTKTKSRLDNISFYEKDKYYALYNTSPIISVELTFHLYYNNIKKELDFVLFSLTKNLIT